MTEGEHKDTIAQNSRDSLVRCCRARPTSQARTARPGWCLTAGDTGTALVVTSILPRPGAMIHRSRAGAGGHV